VEPIRDDAAGGERPKLSRRKLAIAGAALVVAAGGTAAAVIGLRGGSPGADVVAEQLRSAIAEMSPAKSPTGTPGRFDTAALRQRLDGSLEGWYVDLAADSGATRVGAAARALEGGTCVFAWSDVGAPLSAVVTDPALPCTADIALIPAKAPA
jgi:hypothetical protein